jgi:hypothetical protein
MVIEQQKPPLMQIIILGEARPAALEEHLSIAIIIHLHLVWRTSTLHFSEDGFAKLLAIHKLSKFQRHTLLLMALGTSKCKKKRKHFQWMVAED